MPMDDDDDNYDINTTERKIHSNDMPNYLEWCLHYLQLIYMPKVNVSLIETAALPKTLLNQATLQYRCHSWTFRFHVPVMQLEHITGAEQIGQCMVPKNIMIIAPIINTVQMFSATNNR
jgi:hypothetical protein